MPGPWESLLCPFTGPKKLLWGPVCRVGGEERSLRSS